MIDKFEISLKMIYECNMTKLYIIIVGLSTLVEVTCTNLSLSMDPGIIPNVNSVNAYQHCYCFWIGFYLKMGVICVNFVFLKHMKMCCISFATPFEV